MKDSMKLFKPVIIHKKDKSEIYAEVILSVNRKEKLWYEVSRTYGEYLYEDRADPFLLAILPYCMVNGIDIVVDENTGISADLLYQLTEILIPSLKGQKQYKQINITSKVIYKKLKEGTGAATGITRGVDSFYTVLKNMNGIFPLTHLTLFNVQGFGEYGGDAARCNFRKDIEEAQRICQALSLEFKRTLPLISVDSNIHEILPVTINNAATYRDMSAVLVLKQLFSNYYFSNGWSLDDFSLDSIRKSEPWLLYCLSTEKLRLQLYGVDMTRLEKIKYISKFPLTYDSLQVCHQPALYGGKGIKNSYENNCTYYCEKCRKTVLELMAAGCLEKYGTVFDLELVKEHYDQYMEELIQKRNQPFFNEIYIDFQNQGKVPAETRRLTADKQKSKEQAELITRNARIADCLDRILYLKQRGVDLKERLKSFGYAKIAVYGIGRIGRRLLDEFGDMVSYGIDREGARVCYKEFKILRSDEEFPEVDLSIITTAFDEDSIRGSLNKKMTCKIWNMEQFLSHIEETIYK